MKAFRYGCVVFGLMSLACRFATAFPENLRHGYANCTACHVAPNGGGLLTPYGRQLSQEVVSTWGTQNETSFLYAFKKLPEWLNLGGDVRWVQTYRNTPQIEQSRFIFMQADLEAGLTYKQVSLVGTVGRQEATSFNQSGPSIFSRRHYVLYQPSEKLAFRFGRFFTAYGINTENHMITTRRGLGWDEGSETYNLEGAYLGDNADLFVSGSFGRPDLPTVNSGLALRSSLMLGERTKLGASYFLGTNASNKRHLFGPFAIVGLTPHLFVLAEIDFQRTTPTGADGKWGMVDYLRLDYEFIKGLHGYVTQEFAKLDLGDPKATLNAYGVGVQWFPRPHFEVNAQWQKRQQFASTTAYADFAWLLFHFYP